LKRVVLQCAATAIVDAVLNWLAGADMAKTALAKYYSRWTTVDSNRIKKCLYYAILFLLPLVFVFAFFEYYYIPGPDWIVRLYIGAVKCMVLNFIGCAFLHRRAGGKSIYLPLVYGIALILFYIFPSESLMTLTDVIMASIPISLTYALGFIMYDKFQKRHEDTY